MRFSHKDVKEAIKKHNQVLLIGDPGIGKSQVVKDTAKKIAKEMGRNFVEYSEDVDIDPDKDYVFVDIRLSTVEPADLIGLPKEKDGYFQYLPPRWAYILSKCPGLLFLDEITASVRDDVISAAFQLVLDKRSGFVKFNENVKIVAAGNPPESNSVARGLPAPLVNRFLVIEVEPPSVEQWIQYMAERHKNWRREVAAFLTKFPSEFCKPGEAETTNQFPTPRTWELLALSNLSDTEIFGYIGKETGLKFKKFLELSKKVDIEKLVEQPELLKSLDYDTKLFALSLLAGTNFDLDKVLDVMIDIGKERVDLFIFFASLLDAERRKKMFLEVVKRDKDLFNALGEVFGVAL